MIVFSKKILLMALVALIALIAPVVSSTTSTSTSTSTSPSTSTSTSSSSSTNNSAVSFAAGQAIDSLACGKACLSKGQYNKAVNDFQAVVKKSPKSCEGHLLLGQVYCKLKQFKQGKEQLRLAIRFGHGSANAQKANIALLKLPEEFLAPKIGLETGKLASMLGLSGGSGASGAAKPTVIDFYATWCNPCTQLHQVLEKAKTEYGDKVTFMRVDVDDPNNAKLVDQYEVSPIPTVVYLNEAGEVVSFSVGYSGDAGVRDGIKKILSKS